MGTVYKRQQADSASHNKQHEIQRQIMHKPENRAGKGPLQINR